MKTYTIIFILAFLTSCSSSLDRLVKEDKDSSTYNNNELGSFSNVSEGVILSIREVNIAGSKALGTTLGTVLGGLLGASTTDKKHNKEAATVVGALGGAFIGSIAEKYSTQDIGYEFLIKTSSGVKVFVDTEISNLKTGDSVYIIKASDGRIRLSKK